MPVHSTSTTRINRIIESIPWINTLSPHPLPSQEYERLAAQLDGAKKDLTKKVNEISQAADKEDLVTRAEDHADQLSKLAMELQK